MNYSFKSTMNFGSSFKSDWTQDEIKNEPMLFNNSFEAAYKNGGPITRAFLDELFSDSIWDTDETIVDSRTHMLMPGWYPCIPGFHHDDVARDATGQPNYDKMPYEPVHILGLVNGEICPTVFAIGAHELPKVEPGKIVYKEWHPIVERQIKEGVLTRVEVPSGRLVYFDWQSMHAGQKATKAGWRWFIRLTRRCHKHTNEVRKQVNVYLDSPFDGW